MLRSTRHARVNAQVLVSGRAVYMNEIAPQGMRQHLMLNL